ncbi:MAG: hypothetical protein QNJ30_27655 [Kiloniellales bacterium]|nr:hypothetical protein [Kiloniellales bacterium]
MTKWLYIAVPAALGWVAFEVMQPTHWDEVGRGLTFALSLLGAAVLVRLARGMPVSDTGYFDVEEMRDLSRAVRKVYKALMLLFVVIICSILGLVFIGVLHGAISHISNLDPGTILTLKQSATGVLVALVAFALLRAVALIKGDYDLVKKQASLMERAVERRQAARQAERLEAAEKEAPFEKREGYGKLAQ